MSTSNDIKDKDTEAETVKNKDKHNHAAEAGRSIVARFESPAEAREAIAALHKAHYTKTWMGATSVARTSTGDEAVTVDGGGFLSSTQRLVDALVTRGVLGDTARQVEQQIKPGDALVTLDLQDKDSAVAQNILATHGAHLAGDESYGAATDGGFWHASSQPRTSTATFDPAMDYGADDTFVYGKR